MKALIVDKFGKNSNLLLAEGLPRPTVDSKNILIKVHACSLNPIDYKIKSGFLNPLTLLKKEKIVGSDFCGEIVALGSLVDRYNIGDLVYGMIRNRESKKRLEKLLKENDSNIILIQPKDL